MTISFENQVAVITGGGGDLGRAQALDLSRRGAAVVVNDAAGLDHPDGPAADAVVAAIESEGGRAVASYDSVATPDGGRAIIELALETYGRIDAILHYAGSWRHVLVEDLTADELDPVLDVHLRGAVFVVQPAWSVMKDQGYGRIVLVSSTAGLFGRLWGANYSAAKGGLIGLGRALAIEGSDHGIRANCLLPIAKPAGPKKYTRDVIPDGFLDEFKKAGLSSGIHPPGSASERLIAMPTYLASRDCATTGNAFQACAGQYSRVFIGVTDGWLCEADAVPAAEDVAAHLDEIMDLTEFIVPESAHDAVRQVAARIAERDGTPI
jgi:NAD(P)-dependent dehydrogenase (short-subunit alcohol dehydrogenase family)